MSKTALHLIKDFFHFQFVLRDALQSTRLFSRDIQWFGTSDQEDVTGIDDAAAYLRSEIAANPEPYEVTCRDAREQILPGGISTASLRGIITGAGFAMSCRITAVAKPEDGEMKICTLHMSVSDTQQQEGEYFPFSLARSLEQDMYRQFLTSSLNGGIIAVYLEPGFPLYMLNPRMLDYLGYPDEETFNREMHGLVINCIHPEDRDLVTREVDEQIARSGEYQVTYRMVDRNGAILWVDDRGREISTPDGRRAIVCTCFDITARKQAEGILTQRAKRAELLDMLVNNAAGGIFRSRLDGDMFIVDFANPTYYAQLGYTKEQFESELGNTVRSLVHPDDLRKIISQVDAYLAGNPQDLVFEYRVTRRDGTQAFLRNSAVIREDDTGVPIIVGIIVDVTKNKLIELEDRRKSEEIRQIYNTIPGGIFRCRYSIDGDLLSANDGVFSFLGYTREEFSRLFENKMGRVIHPDDFENMRQKIHDQLEHGPTVESVCRLICRDGGTKWISIHGTLDTQPDGEQSFYCIFVDITVQKDTERRLLESEQRYRLAIEGAGVNVWEYDILKRRISQSSGSHFRHGYDLVIDNVPESLIEMDHVLPEQAEAFRDMYHDIEQGKPRAGGDFWIPNPDGNGRWCERITYAVAFDPEGHPIRAYGASQDVTQEKLAEKRYQEELQYREQTAESIIASCRINITKGRVEALRIGTRDIPVDGHEPASGLRDRACRFLHSFRITDEQNEKLSPKCLREAFGQGTTHLSEEFLARRTPNASHIWVRTDVNLLRRPESSDIVAFFYHHDITAERTLHNLVHSVIRMDYDYLCCIDANTESYTVYIDEEQRVTPQAQKNFHYNTLATERVRALVPPEEAEFHIRALRLDNIRSELKRSPVFNHEIRLRGADGTYRHKLLRFACMDPEAGLILMTRSDIDDIVRREQAKQLQLEQAVQAAEKASRAKSDFLARMSHDMRTPMNAIIGMAALGLDETSDANAADYFHNITLSAEFLTGLINDILDMARLEQGTMDLMPAPYPLHEFMAQIRATIAPLCEAKHIHFTLEAENIICDCLFTDRLRVGQIFTNLLSNAVKFTPEGGTISLHMRQELEDDGTTTITGIVRDSGIGISRNFQHHMFEPFTQEKSTLTRGLEGSGLGLAITKRLIDLMHGSISVDSTPGQGTVFTVTFRAPICSTEKTEIPATPGADILRGRHVLLCEDHPMNTVIAVKMLEKMGMIVDHAGNGQIGVELFRNAPESTYDLVLMDIRMPVMDGLSAARAIRSLPRADAKAVPILAMTANAYPDDEQKSRDAGMDGHIAKPIEPEKVRRMLQQALGRQQTNQA